MADVYGFNEAKSKIAVVDKATQDEKDSSQDSRMTALETKNTEQDNRLTALEEASGGALDVEDYGEIATDTSVTITFPTSVSVYPSSSISNTSLKTWEIYSKNQSVATGLYYDTSENKLKECNIHSIDTTKSTTIYTSYYREDLSTAEWLNPFSFLVGMSITSTTNKWVLFSINSCVVRVNVTFSGNTVSSVDSVTVYASSNTTKSFSGSYTAQYVRDTYPLNTNMGSLPSTYTKIIDL